MRYFTVILFLFSQIAFAEKTVNKSAVAAPAQQVEQQEEIYIDPNDVDGEGYIDPYDDGIIDGKGVDPNDFYPGSEDGMEKKQDLDYSSPDDLFADSPEGAAETPQIIIDANKSWVAWRKLHFQSPKPPLEWDQVGLEIGAGYAGAFGGSVLGIFSGFLVGSLYEAMSNCDQCWVDVAANMSTFGATLGVSAGVYIVGNNEKQMGSLFSTYMGALLPVVIGAFVFDDSDQLSRTGLYILTMPLTAAIGYNISRHSRQKDEKPYFDYFSADDMWVSKGRGDTLALNLRWKF